MTWHGASSRVLKTTPTLSLGLSIYCLMLKDKWPWLLLATAVFISSLYEYGYWSVFRFNAFEYFTIDSLIKNFAYIIISGFKLSSLTLIVSLVPQFISQLTNAHTSKKGLLQELREGHPKAMIIIELVVALGMITLLGIMSSVPQKSDSTLYTLAFGAIALFIALEDRLSALGSPLLRLWGTYLLLSYSYTALDTGRKDALAIIRNENPSLITFSEAEQKDIGCKQAKLIGILGDSYVLLTLDNQQTFLVLKEHLPTLRMGRDKKTIGLPRK
jgi:hypothetical protein